MNPIELNVSDVSDEQLHFYRFQSRNWGGLHGRLFINDVEIHEFSPTRSQVSCSDIQNWLMPGDNTVVVSVTDMDPGTQTGAGECLYECSLHGMPTPNLPDDSNCLWTIRIDDLQNTQPFTRVYSFGFTSLQVPTSRLWRKADVIDLLPEPEKQRVLQLQDELVAAFRHGDSAKLLKLYEFVVQEETDMRKQDSNEIFERIREEMLALSEMSREGLVQFHQETDVYFNHLAGNRVVQLCSEEGGATIRLQGEGEEYIPINIFASRIDGQWNLVRR